MEFQKDEVIREKKVAKISIVRYTLILLVVLLIAGISFGGGVVYANGQLEQKNSSLNTQTLSVSEQTGDGSVIFVVDKAADSVVEISTEYKQVNSFAQQFVSGGAGSGVILTADGYIVTNYHVISTAEKITVTLTDGNEYEAELIGYDEQTDLAVLKITATELTAAVFSDSDQLQVGQMVVAIGNPLGELGGTVTEGIISATSREITIDGQTMNLLQTSAAVNSGNSGGGLFDSNGNLVGIVNAKSSGSGIEGLAFAIPANTVAEVVSQIISQGYVSGRPQLGIQTSDRTYQWGQVRVYVNEVISESALKAGDIILSIEGQQVNSSSDIQQIINNYQVGDTVSLVVERDGSQKTIKVTLSEKTN